MTITIINIKKKPSSFNIPCTLPTWRGGGEFESFQGGGEFEPELLSH